MPRQEAFMDRKIGNRRVRVLKIYDRFYAREVLEEMDETARIHLWNSLRLNEGYEASDTPAIDSTEAEDLLWDALLEDSREDGHALSFFVVTEDQDNKNRDLYVSPDWPSAEQFANSALGEPAA